MTENKSVLQDWVMQLPRMQQSILLTATRAPDGLIKNHPVKTLCRWLRRCYMICAFEGVVHSDPYEYCGGNFTGTCKTETVTSIEHAQDLYIQHGDQIPLHFHFHLQQAAEVLGYKHPDPSIQLWWYNFYLRFAAFGHLNPETEEQFDKRCGDNRENWMAREA